MKKKGLIISFEGIDGCGKTTQANLFFEYLKESGLDILLLNEPGGTYAGEKIRDILLDSRNSICPFSELFLYLASRLQLVEEMIRPAVEKGTTIILDRYVDSTTAYQGYGRKLPIKFIESIHRTFIGSLMPNITFLIDAPAENLLPIIEKKKRDRIEEESIEFQKRVRKGYLAIARKNRTRVHIIKRKTQEQTHKEIVKEWGKFLNGLKDSAGFSLKSTKKR